MTRGELLRKIAKEVLGEEIASRLWKRLEFIGDIALIRTPLGLEPLLLKPLAEEIIKRFPYVKSVWAAIPGIEGAYRLRKYIWLAGEQRSETVYKEHGCLFKVDINKVYISPSLNYEHIRIAKLVEPGEVVVNMFAGAGLFSIIIAKYSNPLKVYSIDINPDAYYYMVENIKLNRVEHVVEALLGDAKDVIMTKLRNVANRVLMPYPELALEYLAYALEALQGRRGYIHVYLHVKTERGEHWKHKALSIVDAKLQEVGVRNYRILNVRKIRNVGPRMHQVVVDVHMS
ncbi:MAG: class I SAM-dependent methyltransferase family protein [Desulfurococcaceae archaeon]